MTLIDEDPDLIRPVNDPYGIQTPYYERACAERDAAFYRERMATIERLQRECKGKSGTFWTPRKAELDRQMYQAHMGLSRAWAACDAAQKMINMNNGEW